MAKFNTSNADNYGGQGGSGYFSLKNDKDTARVRFLYNGIDDVEGFSVHEVEVNGKKRYVNCLREYGAPVSDCPFCANGKFTNAKYFIPLYNEDTGSTVIWERGKQFGSKLSSICARYPNLVSHIFDIERNGRAGDTKTTYEIYEVDDDDKTLDDFEMPNILGGLVLDKTADELQYYLDNGYFPNDNSSSDSGIQRRGGDTSRDRRTPNGRRDSF